MASVNKWIGVGNLGRDPESRTFPSGDMVCNITIACTDKWKDRETGEAKEHTEWVRIVFNGRLAEIAGQFLRKGSQVYIEGSLRTRKWTDQAGVEKYSTEIRADQMQMLGSRQDGGGGGRDQGGYDDGGRQQGRQQPQQQRQAPQQGQQRQAPQQAGGYQNQPQGRGPAPQQRQAPQQGAPSQGHGFEDFPDDVPF